MTPSILCLKKALGLVVKPSQFNKIIILYILIVMKSNQMIFTDRHWEFALKFHFDIDSRWCQLSSSLIQMPIDLILCVADR